MIRDLLDRATAWERALTAAGFDVIDLQVGTQHQRKIGVCIAGGEDTLVAALAALGLSEPFTFTKCTHGATSTLPPRVAHISAQNVDDAYVRVDAVRPATEAEIAEMDAEAGDLDG